MTWKEQKRDFKIFPDVMRKIDPGLVTIDTDIENRKMKNFGIQQLNGRIVVCCNVIRLITEAIKKILKMFCNNQIVLNN